MSIFISLGGTCAVAYNIRKFSPHSVVRRYPFDWAKMTIKQLNAVLENDFADYEKLELKKFSENHPLLTEDEFFNDLDVSPSPGKELTPKERGLLVCRPQEQPLEGRDLPTNYLQAPRMNLKQSGSLILSNPYGITFAHQIVDKDQISIFSSRLRDERITAFKELKQQTSMAGSATLKFIRFETGKIKKGYEKEVQQLLKHLANVADNFELILLIHKDSVIDLELIKENGESIKVVYFDAFDEDWRYHKIDWSFFLS